ncbi:MAG: peptidoglycan recognition protein family protein [Clostridiales bacterium]|nr:peptidoglycan recognition protein family protein [Clostridiales bacterium]
MEREKPSHLAPSERPPTGSVLFQCVRIFAIVAAAGLLVGLVWLFTEYAQLPAIAADSNASDDTSSDDQLLADAAAQNSMAAALAQSAAAANVPTVLDDLDWVTVDLIPVNEYSRPGDLLDGVNAIVVHYTGNPGTTAQQNRDCFASLAETGEDSVSSHFVIGTDGEIIQCIPLDEKSYCSNDRNHDTISIECCHLDTTGEFTQETIDSLVKLVQYLVDCYGLDEDGVIRHYDVTGKLCPYYYATNEDAWLELKALFFPE